MKIRARSDDTSASMALDAATWISGCDYSNMQEPDALVERFVDCGKRERAVEILLQFYRPAAALKLLREMPIATPKQRALEHRCLTALDGRDSARTKPGSSSTPNKWTRQSALSTRVSLQRRKETY